MAESASNMKALPTVWFIDENAMQRQTFTNALRSALPDTIKVREQEPFKSLQDYLPMLANPQTACIITDQRLKESGVATYTGIDLADFIRGFNSKLPIYILTNYADDTDEFIGLEWSVDDIIAKADLADAEGQQIVAARIARRVDTYKDVLDKQSKRTQELISKSSREMLSESELEELENLGLQRSSPALAEELTQAHQLQQLIQEHESLMKQYQDFIAAREGEEEIGGR